MKVVTEILQDLEILKRLLKHNANLKIRINYYLTHSSKYEAIFKMMLIFFPGRVGMGDCFLDLDFFNWTDHLVLTRFL